MSNTAVLTFSAFSGLATGLILSALTHVLSAERRISTTLERSATHSSDALLFEPRRRRNRRISVVLVGCSIMVVASTILADTLVEEVHASYLAVLTFGMLAFVGFPQIGKILIELDLDEFIHSVTPTREKARAPRAQ